MRGSPPKFPRALEKVLVSTTLALRELRATITKPTIMSQANLLFQHYDRSEFERCYPDGVDDAYGTTDL